ncbi:MAG: hypothetical protein VKJ44_06795 [Synechococcus sp.]|nr:hypothetical protein [Synechococcus sp.]
MPLTPEKPAASIPALWLELDWLLALPLEGPALSVLWSAVQRELAAAPQRPPGTETALAALEAALERQEIYNLRSCCLDGDWIAGLARLEERARQGWQGQEMQLFVASLAFPLLQELHHRLLDDDAPPCPYDTDQRAELLWRGHVLLGLLEPLSGPRPARLPVVIEQISRYGALAWMERQGPEAAARAIALLQRLAEVNPEARFWVEPALQERLAAASAPVLP